MLCQVQLEDHLAFVLLQAAACQSFVVSFPIHFQLRLPFQAHQLNLQLHSEDDPWPFQVIHILKQLLALFHLNQQGVQEEPSFRLQVLDFSLLHRIHIYFSRHQLHYYFWSNSFEDLAWHLVLLQSTDEACLCHVFGLEVDGPFDFFPWFLHQEFVSIHHWLQ